MLQTTGTSPTNQVRYIDYAWEQEENYPICGLGFASDPGTCDDEGGGSFCDSGDTGCWTESNESEDTSDTGDTSETGNSDTDDSDTDDSDTDDSDTDDSDTDDSDTDDSDTDDSDTDDSDSDTPEDTDKNGPAGPPKPQREGCGCTTGGDATWFGGLALLTILARRRA
jgi:MYXO-CTERM domain-containing protein